MFVFSIRPEGEPVTGSRFIVARAEHEEEARELARRYDASWTYAENVVCVRADHAGFNNNGPKGIVFPFQSLALQRH